MPDIIVNESVPRLMERINCADKRRVFPGGFESDGGIFNLEKTKHGENERLRERREMGGEDGEDGRLKGFEIFDDREVSEETAWIMKFKP